MTTPTSVFANGLINAFRNEHARHVIVGPLTNDVLGWSRMFTGYSPAPEVRAALYKQLFNTLGQRALEIEIDDEKGQARISTAITKLLGLFVDDFIDAFLLADRSDLKPEIKAVIGDKYDEVKKIMGEDKIILDLVVAAIAVYAEALTDEFYRANEIKTGDQCYLEGTLTPEQNMRIQSFNFNISNKINDYLRTLTIDDLKKPSTRITMNQVLVYILSVATQSTQWFSNNMAFIFGFLNPVSHDEKQLEMSQIYEQLPRNDPDVLSDDQVKNKLYTRPNLEWSLKKIDLALIDTIDGLNVYNELLSQSGSADATNACERIQGAIKRLLEQQATLKTCLLNISSQNLKETINQSDVMLNNIKMAVSDLTQPQQARSPNLFNVYYILDCVREFITGVNTREVMENLEDNKQAIIKSMDKMKAGLLSMKPVDESENQHRLDMEE